MPSLNELSATEIAQGIAAGKFTAEAVTRDCLDRIAAREPTVHAWATIDPDHALEQARALDRGPRRGALHGVPIGVKDVIDTFDLPTEMGSPIYKGNRAACDAACVALVRAAGAVILGKTVTAEFAGMFPGPTTNPHNPAHTPGGSSSGSAAAVADHHGAGGVRHPDRRLGAAAGRLLRRRRLQADLQPDQPRRHQVRGRDARHHRAHCAHDRRRRARSPPRSVGKHAGATHARRCAADRALPHAALGHRAAGNQARGRGCRQAARRRRRHRCARSRCRRNSRASITPRARPSTITSARSRMAADWAAHGERISKVLGDRIKLGMAMQHEDYVAALRLAEALPRAHRASAFDGLDCHHRALREGRGAARASTTPAIPPSSSSGPCSTCRRCRCRPIAARTACRSASSWSRRATTTTACSPARAGLWKSSARPDLFRAQQRADGLLRARALRVAPVALLSLR